MQPYTISIRIFIRAKTKLKAEKICTQILKLLGNGFEVLELEQSIGRPGLFVVQVLHSFHAVSNAEALLQSVLLIQQLGNNWTISIIKASLADHLFVDLYFAETPHSQLSINTIHFANAIVQNVTDDRNP